jgi:hypothetical protein
MQCVAKKVKSMQNEKIVQGLCTNNSTVVLNNKGKMFYWGKGEGNS